MTRVNLEIPRGPYQPALPVGLRIESCRLLTDVSFRRQSGWTVFRPAIVDTGAPLSLFPRSIWQAADVERISRLRIGGLARKPECMLDVTLALVRAIVRDQDHQLGPIEMHALLADTDQVPAFLGMRGLLGELALHTNVAEGIAYLESAI